MAYRRCLNAQHDFYLGGQLVLSVNKPPWLNDFPRLDIHQNKGVGGWHSSADHDAQEVHTQVGRRGELPYGRTSRGKTLTYNLLARTRSGDDLDEMMDEIRQATQDNSTLGLLVVTPWVGVATDIWSTYGTILEFDGDELFNRGPGAVPSPFIREPILSFRQIDGVWMYANESGTFLVPMSWSDTGTSASVDVTNSGGTAADPVITVTGVNDGEDLHIGRTVPGGTDVDLWFRDPVGVAGLTGAYDVKIDFATHPRAVTVDGTEDAFESYDATSSSWWDAFQEGVPPGTHTIWIGPGSGTGIEVEFYSTSK